MSTRLRAERNFPIRGIREDLPEGEQVLWQGAPDWRHLAVNAFHVRKAALYFAALLALRVGLLLAEGQALGTTLLGSLPMLVLALAGVGVLCALALWSSRTTVYAITSRRVVMRVGMALPIVVNLPFSGIQAAQLREAEGGIGDLPLTLRDDVRLAYVHLWPYARPWRLAHPQPMLRSLPQAAQVAQTLSHALATSGGMAHAVQPAALAADSGEHRPAGRPRVALG